MPAYNASQFIAESIESIINQTYKNWELLVVDDGSTDSTANIIKTFAAKDNRIKYYFQQNGKQGKARNKALNISQGEFIAFLDADDLWMPNKLELQIKLLKNQEKLDAVFCHGFLFKNNIESNLPAINPVIWSLDQIPNLINGNAILIPGVLARKKAIENVEGFTENPALQNVEDYDLWLKMLINDSNFYCMQESLFRYRIHFYQATFQQESLSEPLLQLYINCYENNNTKPFSAQLLYKIAEFLHVAAVEKIANAFLKSWIYLNFPKTKSQTFLLDILPVKFRKWYIQRFIFKYNQSQINL